MMCGRYCKADKQARAMAILYCNKLGKKIYGELVTEYKKKTNYV